MHVFCSLEGTVSAYGILRWQWFSFSTLKILTVFRIPWFPLIPKELYLLSIFFCCFWQENFSKLTNLPIQECNILSFKLKIFVFYFYFFEDVFLQANMEVTRENLHLRYLLIVRPYFWLCSLVSIAFNFRSDKVRMPCHYCVYCGISFCYRYCFSVMSILYLNKKWKP